MLHPNFVWLGLMIGAVGSTAYIVKTIQGRVKPSRLSFFILALAPLVAFGAEVNQGVGLRSLMTLWVGLSPLLILLASFLNPQSYWKLTRFDFTCGALAVIALIMWKLMGSGNLAIALSIVADGLAVTPILVKAWRFPHTESVWLFIGTLINSAIALLVLDRWTFADYAFPAYIFLFSVLLVAMIPVRQRLIPRVAADEKVQDTGMTPVV